MSCPFLSGRARTGQNLPTAEQPEEKRGESAEPPLRFTHSRFTFAVHISTIRKTTMKEPNRKDSDPAIIIIVVHLCAQTKHSKPYFLNCLAERVSEQKHPPSVLSVSSSAGYSALSPKPLWFCLFPSGTCSKKSNIYVLQDQQSGCWVTPAFPPQERLVFCSL